MAPVSILRMLPVGTSLPYVIPYALSMGWKPSLRFANSDSMQNVRSPTGTFLRSDRSLSPYFFAKS